MSAEAAAVVGDELWEPVDLRRERLDPREEPATGRRAPRPVRSKRRTSSWRSSAPMRLLTADCVEDASVAAREKLPVAAT